MNRLVIFLLAATVLASCSSPKYTYNFDYYDYNAGKRKAEAGIAAATVNDQPAEPVLTASAAEQPVALASSKISREKKTSSITRYKDMTRSEKKEFRKELKNDFTKYVAVVKKGERADVVGQNSGRLDPDVKMAIIFGAVGLVLFILGGVSEVFTILGAIALLVGVYFLIKWLIRQ